jgi:uncharacterized protein YjbJ (UPF0337 family)
MNWDHVAGNWKQFRGKLKEQWGRITDDDLDVISGKQEQLVGVIQKRYGMAREDAENALNEWLEGADMDDEDMDEEPQRKQWPPAR